MTWEQKLAALQALTETSLKMRKPGDWYVRAEGREIGGDGMLVGEYGNGKTPEEAVENDWSKLAEHLPGDRYIVLRHGFGSKKRRWNGYMWEEVR